MGEINRKNLRNFGAALGIIFLIFGIRLSFKFHNTNFMYLAGVGAFFVISGLIFPTILRPINRIFNKIASLIFGWLITRIVLMVSFYLLITPIGLFLRLIRKDLLELKIDKGRDSYWIKKIHKVADLKQYEKQF